MSQTLRWGYKGERFVSATLERRCPACGRRWSIVELPPSLRAAQPDDTTHVCHPLAGGCNHGFALEMVVRSELHPPTCGCGLCDAPGGSGPDSSEPPTHLEP